MKITKDTTIEQSFNINSSTYKILESYGMGCEYCKDKSHESIELGAIAHGIDIDKLLKELNRI